MARAICCNFAFAPGGLRICFVIALGGALLVCVFLGVLVSFCVSKAVFRKFLLGKVCGGVSVCVFFLLWGGLLVFWGGASYCVPLFARVCVCLFFSPARGGPPNVLLMFVRRVVFVCCSWMSEKGHGPRLGPGWEFP